MVNQLIAIATNHLRVKYGMYRMYCYLYTNYNSAIICAMIVPFGDKATEDLYHSRKTSRVRRFPANVTRVALRKLDVIRGAHKLQDLRVPPGNRLEQLQGDYAGFHSIRVNQQWRIVFRWHNDDAYDISLVDYHS